MPPIPAARNNDFTYPYELRTSDATPTLLGNLTTYPGGAYKIKLFVSAIRQATGDCAGWEIIGSYKNIGGTVQIIGGITILAADKDIPSWDVNITTSGSFVNVYCTGVAANTILWRGEIVVKRMELIK